MQRQNPHCNKLFWHDDGFGLAWRASTQNPREQRPMVDASSPSWDRDGKHLHFLASTDVALASGWANTSQMAVDPRYSAYVIMTGKLRAAVTNEVPDGRPLRLPAGLIGPKVLLINERVGSGGDLFPWVFRQQKAGPLIGTRTWGGLVKSSVHYPLVDGDEWG